MLQLPSPLRHARFASSGAIALLASCALAVSALPSHAQPLERAGEGRVVGPQQTPALRRWQQLVERMGAREVTHPRQTLEVYEQFGAQHADEAAVAIAVATRRVRLLWRVLGEREAAAALYQRALESYGGAAEWETLRAEWEQLRGEAAPGLAPVELKWPNAKGTAVAPVAAPTLPAGTAGAPINAARLVAIPTLLQLLERGEADAEAAWQASGLAVEELPALIVGVGLARKDALLRGQLAELLARHGDALLEQPEALPLVARVALADFYARQKDARAIALYESVLRERVAGGKSVRPVSEVWSLAGFYRDTGEVERAVATYLRAGDYSTSRHMIDEMKIEAARLLRANGKSERAGLLYQQVQSEGAGWMKGMALYDEARALMAQGQHEEARQLLKTPVEGKNAEQVKVGLLALLGDSYLRTGDMEEARRYSRSALEQYNGLSKPLQGEGLREVVHAAQERLRTIEEKSAPVDPDFYAHGEVYRQAHALIKADKHEAARALLQQPVTGEDAPKIKVGLLSLLSASYLKTGEVELAQTTAQEALDAYQSLLPAPTDRALQYQSERAQKVREWCRRYRGSQ